MVDNSAVSCFCPAHIALDQFFCAQALIAVPLLIYVKVGVYTAFTMGGYAGAGKGFFAPARLS